MDGTPLADSDPLDPFGFVQTIAVAHIATPTTMLRISAGREQMGEALQALCFAAGCVRRAEPMRAVVRTLTMPPLNLVNTQ